MAIDRYPLPPECVELLAPLKLWTWAEVSALPRQCLKVPGVYAWWFTERPTLLPPEFFEGAPLHEGARLLYIGIAQSSPKSSERLGGRIRFHFCYGAEGSTLRISLGCLLGFTRWRVSSDPARAEAEGRRTSINFSTHDEQALSQWMSMHARVCWLKRERPWELEPRLLRAVCPPLNLQSCPGNRFATQLKALRKAAKTHALQSPVLPRRRYAWN